jgi:hypothetical protein
MRHEVSKAQAGRGGEQEQRKGQSLSHSMCMQRQRNYKASPWLLPFPPFPACLRAGRSKPDGEVVGVVCSSVISSQPVSAFDWHSCKAACLWRLRMTRQSEWAWPAASTRCGGRCA